MMGTIVNCTAILTGSVIGSTLNRGIKEQYKNTMMQGLGLAASVLGINNCVQAMPKSAYPVLFIFSLAFGGLLGEMINLDQHFQQLTTRFSKGNLAQGLSTAILLFCVGTLSILGPMESALHHNNTLLYTNAMLDFVTSMILASSFGIGIAFSAVVLFLWQGSIYVFAQMISGFLTQELMTEISIIGGVLILSSGLSILEIKKCKTMNLLPALLVPAVFLLIKSAF